METKRICPGCQKPLAPDVPMGLCPECLIKAGFPTGADTETGSAAHPAFVPPAVEEIARLFPQLEVLELIGKGGMGAVYKARQKRLNRLVALKILPPGIGGDPAFAERFTREAQALAQLNHPGIVTLYEFGETSGQFYFLMELVDGVNLRQLLAGGRVSAREALAIVPQICDALQFAHDQGIVHRDIKPENILLDRRGRVKVADFGLAKIMGGQSSESRAAGGGPAGSTTLTGAGKVMGTPQYMSPEQIHAPGEVDHRADIYALGVVFYQMLTGELPGKQLQPPSAKVQIDVRLDEIVLRALEKKPELRYQQVSEVKTMVETVASTTAPADKKPRPFAIRNATPFSKFIFWCAGPVFGCYFFLLLNDHFNGTNERAWHYFSYVFLSFAALCGVDTVFRIRRNLKAKTPVATNELKGIRTTMLISGMLALLVVFYFVILPARHNMRYKQSANHHSSASGPAVERVVSGPPFVARLNRGEVELLAVGNQPWTNRVCWLPNGELLSGRFPTKYSGYLDAWMAGKEMKKIAFQIHDESFDAISYPVCRANDKSGVLILPEAKGMQGPDPRSEETSLVQIIACPTNAATVNLSLGVANGAWETAVTLRRENDLSGATTDGDWSATWDAVTGDKRVAVSCTYPKKEDWALRMVYVDDNSKVMPIQENSSRLDNSQTGALLLVSSNEFAHIKEFQLQRRKYQWVEFRNVSLQPGHATTVTVKDAGGENQAAPILPAAAPELSFGPVVAGPAPVFYIGQTNFPDGDSIEITSVERGENQMTVKGHYRLVSAEEASLSLNFTATNDTHSPGTPIQPPHPTQTRHISKGQGDFELSRSHLLPGLPHISMYANGRAFAGVYFGTQAEALAESKLDLNDPPAFTFGPVMDQVILDSKTPSLLNGTSPQGLTNSLMMINYDSGVLIIGAEENWAEHKSGFDGLYPLRKNDAFSVASNQELKGMANLCINASPIWGENSWDEMSATAVVEQFFGRLADWQFEDGMLFFPAKNNEPFPPIWLFLTHDHRNMGMLQITGFTENPRGVKLRYKLVRNGR